ncbi:MAG TPA: hypothetical protein VG842_10250 [Sediminibacterium sp.]|nr:hypothetical protein [Sediminibacterium sp.]
MKKVYSQGLGLAISALLHVSAFATDTTAIKHLTDGNTAEWQAEKFETDNGTGISYAIDEAGDSLYIALKVPDMRTQMRITNQGMSIYFDKKGKHREGTGIEFPLKREGGGYGGYGGGQRGSRDGNQEPPNMEAIHELLAGKMIGLKYFGMEGLDDKALILGQPGPISLAFNWDANNSLCIEYQLPASLIANPAELKGKPLSVGWKLFGISMPDRSLETASSGITSGSGGGRGGRGGGSRVGGRLPSAGADLASGSSDSRAEDVKIWTKYLMH